jgi:GTP-binding protein HflX
MAVVEQLLEQLGAASQPRFFVFNKMDRLEGHVTTADPDQIDLDPSGLAPDLTREIRKNQGRSSFLVSALTGQGLNELKLALDDFAAASMLAVELSLPYSEAGLLDYVRRFGRIDEILYEADRIKASVHIHYSHFSPLRPFVSLAQKSRER